MNLVIIMMRKISIAILAAIIACIPYKIYAETAMHKDVPSERLELYKITESVTGVPWYVLGGIDQYERSIMLSNKDSSPSGSNISIHFTDEYWCGTTNPNTNDTDPLSIQYFSGNGVDGDGDGLASRESDLDLLFTMAKHLKPYKGNLQAYRLGIWDFYHRDKAVSIISRNALMFEKFGTNELQEKEFPISKSSNYDYKDTFGMARGWGGRRSHEGTDIFADYGTEVKSVTYGVIELKGWNKFGGWRLGIRDINNTYYYYAHLGSFAKDLKVGNIVEPGQLIGAVGSSGYGKEGTSGKFPPHLHLGMYKDNGRKEWSFNPYPLLRRWENDSE